MKSDEGLRNWVSVGACVCVMTHIAAHAHACTDAHMGVWCMPMRQGAFLLQAGCLSDRWRFETFFYQKLQVCS